MAQFTVNGVTYESNEKGNRFYKTTDAMDKKGNHLKIRISETVFEQAWDEFMKTDEYQAELEIEARRKAQEEQDRETEKRFKKQTATPKPRKSKDVAFEMDSIEGHITLTKKQVTFLKLLPDTNFWDNGVESVLWCDCIADDIEWNPMSVGAMISTLREKGLVTVSKDESRQGHPKAMKFTVVGEVVAEKLGLK